MIIDNYNFFRNKLEFTNPGDFYVIHIVIRKKDINKDSSDISKVILQNVETSINPYFRLYADYNGYIQHKEPTDRRVLFTYYISSLEQFNSYEDEIKKLCILFQARAYLFVVKQNNFKCWDDLKIQTELQDHNIYRYSCFIDRFTLYQQNKRNIIGLLDLDGDEVQHKDYIIKNILKWRFMYEVQSPHGCHLIYNHHTPDIFDKVKELLPHKMSLAPQTVLYYNDEKNS